MSVVNTGNWIGTYAGMTKFGGKTSVPLCYVHFETQAGKMILLANKKNWDKYYVSVKLGDSVLVEYSVIQKEEEMVYIFERILMKYDD